MTDAEALQAVTPCMRDAWRKAAAHRGNGDVAEAFHAVNSAAAALFLLGYDLGRVEAMADGERAGAAAG